ncbi:RNA 2',3'-cyclic phosphodiesterase [Arsenicicoccus piscis]|uniref:RNA 2',3'-cyclic phosphodiesterase n=1 Tax=Arsenicicoccus piscis TaxID=673954 RepID=A0ABQ6HMC9_9MICO|nr:RNA 2',3'-cyclic phosphodiesterase [Arsenicicoccus piscis]MCH8626940.1 RNA 2',3'-cyclic phosphodiesterase [Arsenicicoccus piscis]GMA19142.1 RNA 2',3'-cyclic phosphodiesterase [Arsenicicoccus piscis]
MSARLFVAITPPQEVVAHLDTFLEPRRDAAPDVRWSRPDQWHLTLAFLPSVNDRAYERLDERLDEIASQTEQFDLTLRGGGAFPDVTEARVLWIDVDDVLEDLPPLAKRVRGAANASGTAVQGGSFNPHLTVARLAPPHDAIRWVRVLDTYAGPTWTVDELHLVESHLGQGPGGRARHVVRETYPVAA